MNKTILITGGTGLIGKALTEHLLQKGYKISHLSRSNSSNDSRIKTYKWDVYANTIDENCIKDVDAIIHLAGEGIADKRWTKKRREQILKSRTESIKMIYSLLKNHPHQVKTVLSASGISYYGDQGDKLMTEENSSANTFLAEVCKKWEEAVDEGLGLGLRVVKLRTGIVLDKKDGALAKLAMPVKYGVGAFLGSGKQWVPWIHLNDVSRMYVFALENEINGAFNMTAPDPATNRDLTKAIALELKKPLWLPNIPTFALRIILGEMSSAVLESVRASSAKIQAAGFKFKFRKLEDALKDIYRKF